MDALSAMYDLTNEQMRQEIIFQLERYEDYEVGGSRIVAYFELSVLDTELSHSNYKGTESFLKFLTKIFKRSYPMECLVDQSF